jgi:hypothetical protein
MDDAYITFRYARNFTSGLGLVYNTGQRIEGYSNFSWLILISYVIYNKLSPKPRSLESIIPALLLTTNSCFCFWTLSGMETVFYSFLLILSVALYLQENQQSHPVSAYVLGLVCLTRPDGVGYVAVFLIAETFLRIRRGQSLSRYYIKFYSIIFLIIISYIVFKLIYFGSVLPNTYWAKMWNILQERNYQYLLDFYSKPDIALLSVFLISLIMIILFMDRRTWLLLSLVIFNWFYIAYVPLDWMPNYRYHTYIMPILFTLIGLGLTELIRQLNLRSSIYGKIAAIAVIILLYQYITANITVDKGMYRHRFNLISKPSDWLGQIPDKVRNGISPRFMHLAMFLIENSDQNMRVGMSDIGFAGYISNCRVYDFELLVNKKARDLFTVVKSGNEEETFFFIDNELRKEIQDYDPDLLIHHPRYRERKWLDPQNKFSKLWRRRFRAMYRNHISERMEIIKYDKWQKWVRGEKKKVYFKCYRKEGVTYLPSISELIDKYEEIVQEYPVYPAFQQRLLELRQQAGQDIL